MADDALRGDLANATDPAKGAALVGFNTGATGDIGVQAPAILRSVLIPSQFGIVEDGTDQRLKLQALFAAAVAQKSIVRLDRNARYTTGAGLAVPDGIVIEGNGAELDIAENVAKGGLPGRSISLGSNNYIERLGINVRATIRSFFVGQGTSIYDYIQKIEDPLLSGEGGMTIHPGAQYFHGRSVSLPYAFRMIFEVDNVPVIWDGLGAILDLYVEDYAQGINIGHSDNFTIKSMITKGRHSTARVQAGHNGILLSNCRNWRAMYLELNDAGEHAFRYGGGVRGNDAQGSRNWYIDTLKTTNSGGCAFKQNPGSGEGRIGPGRIGQLIGFDVGKDSTGRNTELWRCTSVDETSIGYAEHRTSDGKNMIAAFQFNGSHNCRVDSYFVQNCASLVRIADTNSDLPSAPVTNISVLNGTANVSGNVLELSKSEPTANVGEVLITGDWHGTINTLATATLVTYSGEITLRGATHKATLPTIAGITDERARWWDIDITNINPDTGVISRSMSKRTVRGGTFSIETERFVMGDANSYGYRMTSFPQANDGLGTYGSSLMFNRPASPRPGGGLVSRQYGAAETEVGLEVHLSSPTTASNETTRRAVFLPSGAFYVPSAGAGVIVKSPNGSQWRITVDDSGTLSASSVTVAIP